MHSIRQSLRALSRSPFYSTTVIFSLSLAIAANLFTFSLIHELFRDRLPVVEPNELVRVYTSYDKGIRWGSLSYPDFRDLQEAGEGLADLAAERIAALNLGFEPYPERIYGSMVSANYFEVLRPDFHQGRPLAAERGVEAQEVVLSHSLWKNRFGSDPSVVGSAIQVNGVPYTIVGITGPGFTGTNVGYDAKFWVPIAAERLVFSGSRIMEDRDLRTLLVIGRLADGAKLEQARSALAGAANRLETTYPDTNRGTGITVIRASEGNLHPLVRETVKIILGLLGGLMAMVLIVVCVNVALLSMARAHSRGSELGVQLALGATRRSLVRQVVVESVTLALASGALALLLTMLAARLLESFLPKLGLPLALQIDPGLQILPAAVLLSLLAGLAAGVFPALQSARSNLREVIAQGASGSQQGRPTVRRAFVAAQITCSVVLLVGSGLLLRGLSEARSMDLGFEPHGLVAGAVDLESRGLGSGADLQLGQSLIDEVQAAPGIESAALANVMPLTPFPVQRSLRPAGAAEEEELLVNRNIVGVGYFTTVGIPLLAGRDFERRDEEGSVAVVVVNRALAERFWNTVDVLGKTLTSSERDYTVIGVASDTRQSAFARAAEPQAYFPLAQDFHPALHLLARTRPDLERPAMAELRRTVEELAPGLAVSDLRTMTKHLEVFLLPQALIGKSLGAFAGLALLLASVGLYGALAYSISQRSREIGIRIALGADRWQVRRIVAREGVATGIIGVVIGLAIAAGLGNLLRSFLHGVSPLDLLTFSSSAAIALAVIVVATWLSASRTVEFDKAAELLRTG